jgi:hypothetical protein
MGGQKRMDISTFKHLVDSVTTKDKLMHYVFSQLLFVAILVTATAMGMSNALLGSAIATFLVGVAIEVLDAKTGRGTAELADIIANAVGILTAVLPILIVLHM